MKREDFKNDYDFLKALEDNADEMPTRLEKVLSKFKKLDCIRLNWSSNFDIEYTNNRFYIVGIDDSDEYIFRQKISLNTVESLIKDLEVNE